MSQTRWNACFKRGPYAGNDELSATLRRNLLTTLTARYYSSSGSLAGLGWFGSMVAPGQTWDYKRLGSFAGIAGSALEDFGNFHFGLMAAAYGYPPGFGQLGAGWAQVAKDFAGFFSGLRQGQFQSPYSGSGFPFTPPFGDQEADSKQIRAGYDFFFAMRACMSAGGVDEDEP